MRIRLLTALSFPSGVYAEGSEVEVPPEQAAWLVARGHAELVTAPLPAPEPAEATTLAEAPETGTLPRARKR